MSWLSFVVDAQRSFLICLVFDVVQIEHCRQVYKDNEELLNNVSTTEIRELFQLLEETAPI